MRLLKFFIETDTKLYEKLFDDLFGSNDLDLRFDLESDRTSSTVEEVVTEAPTEDFSNEDESVVMQVDNLNDGTQNLFDHDADLENDDMSNHPTDEDSDYEDDELESLQFTNSEPEAKLAVVSGNMGK